MRYILKGTSGRYKAEAVVDLPSVAVSKKMLTKRLRDILKDVPDDAIQATQAETAMLTRGLIYGNLARLYSHDGDSLLEITDHLQEQPSEIRVPRHGFLLYLEYGAHPYAVFYFHPDAFGYGAGLVEGE